MPDIATWDYGMPKCMNRTDNTDGVRMCQLGLTGSPKTAYLGERCEDFSPLTRVPSPGIQNHPVQKTSADPQRLKAGE